MTSPDIDKFIGSLEKLPTLPMIYTKLQRLLQSPETTIHAISTVISEDQVIAAKVLRIVNSAFYGYPQKIGNLNRAIVTLGFNVIKNLVLATSVWDMFQKIQAGPQFDKENFWRHAIGCAVASRVVAEAAAIKNPDEVFTGGLLHDIGKIIPAIHYPEKFSEVLVMVEQNALTMSEAEKKIFGFDHAQIGAVIAVKWGFPQETIQMIAQHHISEFSLTIPKSTAAVHFGNILAMALGLGSGGEKYLPPLANRVWETLGLNLSSLELIMEKIVRLYQENIEILET
jgi:putative nucleotidyltransferase with HDIG domain